MAMPDFVKNRAQKYLYKSTIVVWGVDFLVLKKNIKYEGEENYEKREKVFEFKRNESGGNHWGDTHNIARGNDYM